MNKTELKKAAALACGMSMKDLTSALAGVLHVIETTLQQGERIAIPGFGTFSVKERPARLGHNPRTGEQVKIAAKKVVKFNPGKGLDIAVKPHVKKAAKKK